MARVAFTLRSLSDGVLRGHEDGVGDDNDGLRASGIQLAPVDALSAGDLFLEAVSTCYEEVDITWAVPITPAEATPVVTQSVLVYGVDGPPETIPSGYIVAEAPSTPGAVIQEGATVFTAQLDRLAPGEFAYFSLFVRYQSTTGDDYYEKVAAITEMVPKNYGSTLDLWNRIPDFYQSEDTRNGTPAVDTKCLGFDNYGEPVGPLLRYLSIFGFEMDRYRSIITHIIRAKDPEYSDVESLDALAFEVGTSIDSTDLGASRLRYLLRDIGNFRRLKGTLQGTEFFVKSLTGSYAEVDTVGREVKVYSTRANYALDPLNTESAVSTVTSRAADDNEASNPLAYELADTPPTSGGGTVYRITSPIDVVEGDKVVFSVHNGTGRYLKWARLVEGTTTGDYATAVGSDPAEDHASLDGDNPYFIIPVSAAGTVNVEFMAVDPFTPSHFLLEKNSYGAYFDGSVVKGGWLIDSTSISDYRWAGTAHNSVSLYSEDYWRTRKIIDDLYQEVLPVDVAATYTISYNNLP